MKIGEAAKKLGVSVKTLQRWDNEGVFIALRNPKNQRYYSEEQITNYLNKSIVKTDIYKLLDIDSVVPNSITNEEYDRLWKNKESNLYKVVGDQIAFKEKDIELLAIELNTTVNKIERYSIFIEQYIGWFDGGESIDIGDIEISKLQCINYIIKHITLYINRINSAIDMRKDLSIEVLDIINEAVIPMVQDEINQRIKELKKLSKEGKFTWK